MSQIQEIFDEDIYLNGMHIGWPFASPDPLRSKNIIAGVFFKGCSGFLEIKTATAESGIRMKTHKTRESLDGVSLDLEFHIDERLSQLKNKPINIEKVNVKTTLIGNDLNYGIHMIRVFADSMGDSERRSRGRSSIAF